VAVSALSTDSRSLLQDERAFQLADAAMCVVEHDGRIVAGNRAFIASFGECAGRALGSLFLEPSDQVLAATRLARIGDEPLPCRLRGLCATAPRARVVSWSCRPVDGFLLLAVVDDAAERAALERELADRTQEFEALLLALPDIYFRLDAQGRIKAWHAGRETELHVPPERFIGHRPQDVVPPAVAPIIAEVVERARRERVLAVAEYALPTPSGDDQFEARLVPCGADEVSAIIRNTTARRRAEAALHASEERLRASQKLEAVGRLAGGVAHDFNNLLTVLLGRLQFLKRAALAGADRENVDEAFEAASHAVSLTRQLLSFSRGQVLETRVFPLNDVVASLEEMLRRVSGEHIEVTLSLDESAGSIRSDPGQIEQVVLNLVLNARDAMRDGGTLVVSTRELCLDAREASLRDGATPGVYVTLAVTDSGCGMTPEVMAHLFEPFFTTKAQGEGTGLGLATVYGIVKRSGGHVAVRTRAGAGSTFELCFPRADPGVVAPHLDARSDTERPALEAPPPPPPAVIAGGGGHETILVVEDEDGVRRLVVEMLERAGYEALSADGGEEAIRIVLERRERIALVLSDIVMPRMNGRTLAGRVLQLQPQLRVLLMSGHDDQQIDPHASAPSLPVLQKPFTEPVLLARVREVLGESPCPTPRRDADGDGDKPVEDDARGDRDGAIRA
jgi:two-component system cell cycle sensor histidine kinase/response regulator CckA